MDINEFIDLAKSRPLTNVYIVGRERMDKFSEGILISIRLPGKAMLTETAGRGRSMEKRLFLTGKRETKMHIISFLRTYTETR